MGSDGEAVQAPLVTKGTADVVIAFEPGEAARALLYLAPEGVLVTATSAIQPVTAALAGAPYNGEAVVSALQQSVAGSTVRFVPVDDQALVAAAGNRKALNMMLLAVAVAQNRIPLTIDELKAAVAACVKPQFLTMNLKAIDEAVASA